MDSHLIASRRPQNICRVGDKVRVAVPATTANLGPGFDCLGMALSIANYVGVEVIDSGLEFAITGEGADTLSRDESNWIYRCMVDIFDRLGVPVPGMRISLHSDIPVERGLGSSATAVVGGLAVANRLCGEPFSDDELLRLATSWEGHPDNVTPAVMGGLTVSVLNGEDVVYIRLPAPSLTVVLFVPDFAMPTARAREVLPRKVDFADAVHNVGRVALLVAALAGGHTELLPIAVDDRLHEPYRISMFPELKLFCAAAMDSGAKACCLSGAGSTIIALTSGHESRVVEAMQRVSRETGIGGRAIISSISSSGYEYLA